MGVMILKKIFLSSFFVFLCLVIAYLAYQNKIFLPVPESTDAKTAFQTQKNQEVLIESKLIQLLNALAGKDNFQVFVNVQLQGKNLEIERVRKSPRKYQLKDSENKLQSGTVDDQSANNENTLIPSKALKVSPGFSDILTVQTRTLPEAKVNNNAKASSKESTEQRNSKESEGVFFDVNREIKTVLANAIKSRSILIVIDSSLGEGKIQEIKSLRPFLIENLGLRIKQGDQLEFQVADLVPSVSFSQKLDKLYQRNRSLINVSALLIFSLVFSVLLVIALRSWLRHKRKMALIQNSKPVTETVVNPAEKELTVQQIAQQNPDELFEILNFWLDKQEVPS